MPMQPATELHSAWSLMIGGKAAAQPRLCQALRCLTNLKKESGERTEETLGCCQKLLIELRLAMNDKVHLDSHMPRICFSALEVVC